MARAQAAISIAPMAPSEWPIIDLMELTGTLYAWSPRQFLYACGLVAVVLLGPRPVRVDVVEVLGPSVGLAHRVLDGLGHRIGLLRRPVMW